MTPENLTEEHAAETIDALCAAFMDYPVMRYVLAASGADYDDHLRALIGFFCNKRLVRGWPVLGVRVDRQVAAAALISEPGEEAPPPEVEAMRTELVSQIGEAAFERLQGYERGSSLDIPEAPHFFLGVIGVRPENQGQGLARVLLDELARMSERHPESTGVCLSTEDPGNVSFYEYMGYRTLGRRTVDDMETWCMFRANG